MPEQGEGRPMTSLYKWHERVVAVLRRNGETVLGDLGNDKTPDVYVKGAVLGVDEFVCGHAIPQKDGSIDIVHDMLQYQRRGYRIHQLGLCDPIMWYTRRIKYERAKERKP